MEAFVVRGGRKLEGTMRVDGAKNAALPILAASVLTEETVVLQGVPMISDVRKMTDILTMLGCQIRRDGHTLTLDAGGLNRTEMPDALSKQIRSSIFLLGPILSRFRQATVTYPGGCEIGLRPIDLHLSGLRSLGVAIHEEGGVIHCDGGNMHSGEVHLDYPSVGATENILMAAVLLPGISVIHNAAREPEIVDLANFINAMGGSVRGAGSAVMTIEGVKHLHGVQWSPMPDRIVAGTLLAAGAITGGTIELTRAPVQALLAVNAKLREMGLRRARGRKTRYSDCAGAFDSVCTAADAAVSRLPDGYAGADAGAAVRVRGDGRGCGKRVREPIYPRGGFEPHGCAHPMQRTNGGCPRCPGTVRRTGDSARSARRRGADAGGIKGTGRNAGGRRGAHRPRL